MVGVALSIEPAVFRRFEYKYRVRSEIVGDLEQAILPYVEPDPHCAASDGAYTVRSIYFDTSDLRFYHEKVDGLRVRKKLRIRTYGQPDASPECFLEIKRKLDQTVLKERAQLPLADVESALNGRDPAETMAGRPFPDRRALERFRFNVNALGLRPSVLVTYERRAFVARFGSSVRVNFDGHLRSVLGPGLDAIYQEAGLRPFETGWICELKFDERPPKWLMRTVSEFQLRRDPYSKYCHGIEGWAASGERLSLAHAGALPSGS